MNGAIRPEFSEIFDLIAKVDARVTYNYERFFEWIKLLLDVQKEPNRQIVRTDLSHAITEAMGQLALVLGGEVARLLLSIKTNPDYLARLADFIPPNKRLKVFSLNYDSCIEDACETAGIELTTGFSPITKRWDPSLFHASSSGINLYKLHGSLRWFGTRDKSRPISQFQYALELRETKSGQSTPSHIEKREDPELILGPGNKLQPDDPFLTLFYEFLSSAIEAQHIVIIGYSYGDPHINNILDRALDAGAYLMDVNPGSPSGKYLSEKRYRHLKLDARDALLNGHLRSEFSTSSK